MIFYCCRSVCYIKLYSLKQHDQHYVEAIKNDVTSQVKIHREHSAAAHILQTKFGLGSDVIFMASKLHRSGCFIE